MINVLNLNENQTEASVDLQDALWADLSDLIQDPNNILTDGTTSFGQTSIKKGKFNIEIDLIPSNASAIAIRIDIQNILGTKNNPGEVNMKLGKDLKVLEVKDSNGTPTIAVISNAAFEALRNDCNAAKNTSIN